MWTSAFVLSSGNASTPGFAPSTKKYGDSDLSLSSAAAARGTTISAIKKQDGREPGCHTRRWSNASASRISSKSSSSGVSRRATLCVAAIAPLVDRDCAVAIADGSIRSQVAASRRRSRKLRGLRAKRKLDHELVDRDELRKRLLAARRRRRRRRRETRRRRARARALGTHPARRRTTCSCGSICSPIRSPATTIPKTKKLTITSDPAGDAEVGRARARARDRSRAAGSDVRPREARRPATDARATPRSRGTRSSRATASR